MIAVSLQLTHSLQGAHMRTFALILFAGVALCLAGCGGGQQSMQATSSGDIPDWFSNPPQDPNFLFEAATATSQDLQMAVDKAVLAGRTGIGRQVELKLNGMQKSFAEETGTADNAQLLQQFTSATKSIVSTSLSGSRVKFQKQVKDGNMWRAYSLVEYPVGEANAALVQAIKKNNEMYTRFRASQSFEELDKEVQKYEDSKKK
jgi:hypothetical protein